MGKREKRRARQLKRKRNQSGTKKQHNLKLSKPNSFSESSPSRKNNGGNDTRKRKRVQTENSDDLKESYISLFTNTPISYCLSKSLVVGDGDFTFSLALAEKWNKTKRRQHLVCTSYDSRASLMRKYGELEMTQTLSVLEKISNGDEVNQSSNKSKELRILHSVDATKLSSYFPEGSFSRIIFNFPHTGSQRVHENRNLVTSFFTSCKNILMKGGQVHVTIKICPPYSNWDLEERAKEAGLLLVEVKPFGFGLYPGYRHRTTDPTAKDLNPNAHAKTFIFVPENQDKKYIYSLSSKKKTRRKKRKHVHVKLSNP